MELHDANHVIPAKKETLNIVWHAPLDNAILPASLPAQ